MRTTTASSKTALLLETGRTAAKQDPTLGVKVAVGFVVMIFLFSVVGSFVVYHLWSGPGTPTTGNSQSVLMIDSANDLDQYATNLLFACDRYSFTLDPRDAQTAKVALGNLKATVAQAKAIEPYLDNLAQFREKVDQVDAQSKKFADAFDDFSESASEMSDALQTMQDTEESFPKYVQKVIALELALYDQGPVSPEEAPLIKQRLGIVDQTLSNVSSVTRLTSSAYAQRNPQKIDQALKIMSEIKTSMDQLLSITPEVGQHDPNIQRKDELSNTRAQALVLNNSVKLFSISWQAMEKSKAQCDESLNQLQSLSKDISNHASQTAANEASLAAKTVESYSRLTLYCVVGLSIIGLLGAFWFATMITGGLTPKKTNAR